MADDAGDVPVRRESGARLERWRQSRAIRLLAEDELVERILACPPEVPCLEWEILRERLAEYGFGRIVGWGVRGTLRGRAATAGPGRRPVLGIGRVPERGDLNESDATALASEIVTMGIRSFRRHALPRWDPRRGRSLASYFIGHCLMKLPDAYERWARNEPDALTVLAADELDDQIDGDPGPDEVSTLVAEVSELTCGDPVDWRIVWMRVGGFTFSEIAATLLEEGTPMTLSEVRRRVRALGKGARHRRKRRNEQ
jgi:hypothetical protein